MLSNSLAGTKKKGRASLSNQDGRYESLVHVEEDDGWYRESKTVAVPTKLLVDTTKSVITYNVSPDVPFDRSINPYRGCEHGCIYCFARPTHTFLGFSAGLDFETRILYKPNASQLLKAELANRQYSCAPIALGVNTDAYQPAEEQLELTRQVLQLLRSCKHPVSIVTKSSLIVRDVDLLSEMAEDNLVNVYISLTTLDSRLKKILEPRAAAPAKRLKTVERLVAAGVPVGVMVAPVIPAINDSEIEAILDAASRCGAESAGYVLLRLPNELPKLFDEWLECHFPERRKHVLNLVSSTRGGNLYDSSYGRRMWGTGAYAQMIARRFQIASRRSGLVEKRNYLRSDLFTRPATDGQMELFSHG